MPQISGCQVACGCLTAGENRQTKDYRAVRRMKEIVITAKAINEAHRLAKKSAETAVEYATRCGQLLIKKKKDFQHGEWQAWIENNCDFEYPTAARYMKAAKQKSTGIDFSSLSKLYGPDKASPSHISQETPTLPEGKYSLIYADPPWRYEFSQTDSRKIENQYPTMALDEIRDLPVADIAADDCILFMWATSPKLIEAASVVEAWGFDYRTSAIWAKPQLGMGYYFRQQHELLLVAIKGAPGVPEPEFRERSVLEFPRTKHSAKPKEYYQIIERMYPHAKRVELFCRSPQPGWHSWGNQVDAA